MYGLLPGVLGTRWVPHSFWCGRAARWFSANSDNLALISVGVAVVLVISKLRVQVGREDFCDVFQFLAILSRVKCFWLNAKTSGNLEKTKFKLSAREDLLWRCTGFRH